MKVKDSNGSKIKAGDRVVCIKTSDKFPDAIDSIVGKIYTVSDVVFIHFSETPGKHIVLDVHPYFHDGYSIVASLPTRFLKIIEDTK